MRELEVLPRQACLALLASRTVGRIAVVVEDTPLVFPVNYRFGSSEDGRPALLLRTRPGNTISASEGHRVSFQIDEIDTSDHDGWSVLVHGSLTTVTRDQARAMSGGPEPHPFVMREDEEWLALLVDHVTGRQITGPRVEWAFHVRGYL